MNGVDFYIKFQNDEGTVFIEKFEHFIHKCIDGKDIYILNRQTPFEKGEWLQRELEAAIINRERFVNLIRCRRNEED